MSVSGRQLVTIHGGILKSDEWLVYKLVHGPNKLSALFPNVARHNITFPMMLHQCGVAGSILAGLDGIFHISSAAYNPREGGRLCPSSWTPKVILPAVLCVIYIYIYNCVRADISVLRMCPGADSCAPGY